MKFPRSTLRSRISSGHHTEKRQFCSSVPIRAVARSRLSAPAQHVHNVSCGSTRNKLNSDGERAASRGGELPRRNRTRDPLFITSPIVACQRGRITVFFHEEKKRETQKYDFNATKSVVTANFVYFKL